MTVLLFVLAALAAAGDWTAVAQRRVLLERLLKPLTLALLIGAAVSADLGRVPFWELLALSLGLVGDVALLFSPAHLLDEAAGDGPDIALLTGLGAFLLGHLAYIAAFLLVHVHASRIVAGVLIVGGVSGLTLGPVLRGARRREGPAFAGAVAAYSLLLAAMAVLAVGTGSIPIAIGGVLFLLSDVTLARDRFVRALPFGPLAVIVTYHLAQALILIGLIRIA